jgi:hypothetical protein
MTSYIYSEEELRKAEEDFDIYSGEFIKFYDKENKTLEDYENSLIPVLDKIEACLSTILRQVENVEILVDLRGGMPEEYREDFSKDKQKYTNALISTVGAKKQALMAIEDFKKGKELGKCQS